MIRDVIVVTAWMHSAIGRSNRNPAVHHQIPLPGHGRQGDM